MKFIFLSFILAMCAFLPDFAGPTQNAPVKEPPPEGKEHALGRIVGPFDPGDVSSPQAARVLLAGARLPGGIVELEGCKPKLREARTCQPASVRQVLDTIVKADPGYKWSLQDDVINVLPSEGIPLLLSVRVAEFNSKDADNPSWALSNLLQLTEVVEAERRLGLDRGPTHIEMGMSSAAKEGGPALPKRAPLNVHMENASVRDVLNTIARVSGHGIWHYRERFCKGERSYRIGFSD